MRILSLCSGVGGLELGVKLAVPGATSVGYVERDACAIEVLAARMEDGSLEQAPIWFDLIGFDARPLAGRVDVVTAGFPCQPHSLAGKRAGVEDERWLWDEVWRVVREVRSPLLYVENVPGLLTSGGFDRVLADLAASGWAAEWDCIPAASVGAPHIRDRVFLLAADADGEALRVLAERHQRSRGRVRAAERGDAEPLDDGSAGPAADADGQRQQAKRRRRKLVEGERAPRGRDADGRDGARPDHADADRSRLEGRGGQARAIEWADAWRRGGEWAGRPPPEPTVRRMDDGLARALDGDRLFVLGNGVVPQAAAKAWEVLWERMIG